jgi:hypothetical protein
MTTHRPIFIEKLPSVGLLPAPPSLRETSAPSRRELSPVATEGDVFYFESHFLTTSSREGI